MSVKAIPPQMYSDDLILLKGVLFSVDCGMGHYLSIEQVDILRESWCVVVMKMNEWVTI